MRYEMISADCHIDLCWLPPDLFVNGASAAWKDRMPYVADGPKGPFWTTAKGANLGLACGMGSGGREYVPGRIYRSDRMASTGLYDDGKKGIRRLTEPELRIKDQDRDGVQAEVLYGILGMTGRLADGEAAVEITRVYNEWLAGFCSTHPERFAGLAAIPNHPLEAAIAEVERVAKRGGLPGLDIANSADIKPLWDPYWNPLWEVINATGLPLHFHTVGGHTPDHIRKLTLVGSDPTRDVDARDQQDAELRRAPLLGPLAQLLAKLAQLVVDSAVVDYIVVRMERSLQAANALVDDLDREALAAGGAVTRRLAAGALARVFDRRPEDVDE